MSEFHPRFFVREGIEWMMRIALLLGGMGVSFPRPSLPAVWTPMCARQLTPVSLLNRSMISISIWHSHIFKHSINTSYNIQHNVIISCDVDLSYSCLHQTREHLRLHFINRALYYISMLLNERPCRDIKNEKAQKQDRDDSSLATKLN